jgi:DNA-binding response OmpR family regulator
MIRFGDITLNEGTGVLMVGAVQHYLTRQEAILFAELARAPETTVTYLALAQAMGIRGNAAPLGSVRGVAYRVRKIIAGHAAINGVHLVGYVMREVHRDPAGR